MEKRNLIFLIATILLIAILSILITNFLNNPTPGELKEITYTEIEKKLENKESFVLIVSQSTCSHCATYKPKIKQIAKEYGFDMYYIDIDLENKKEEFIQEFHLSGATPTTLFFKNGKETSVLNRLEGDLANTTVIKNLKELGFINE